MSAFLLGCRLLPRCLSPCTPSLQQRRLYALSRFPNRTTAGFGRNHRGNISHRPPLDSPLVDRAWTPEGEPLADHSHTWEQSIRTTTDPEVGLGHLLLNNDELVVTRQLEMLNIFMGFEQCNRYTISNLEGEPLGYIVEEPRGFLSMFARQIFRTHRPFRALVMDLDGSPILWMRRPFSWINSRMYVQRPNPKGYLARIPEKDLVLDTFAEVQQEWHPWRRKYNLFLRSTRRVLTTLDSNSQPEPSTQDVHFDQFAYIDGSFLAWSFVLRDAQGRGIATVERAFMGWARELFADAGRYNVSFRASDEKVYTSGQDGGLILHKPGVTRDLTINERALILATAINIDYDYFSRHSQGGHGYSFWWDAGE